MPTMWRKAMLYLGLGPDDEYDDYDPGVADDAPDARQSRPASGSTPAYPEHESAAVGPVRPVASGRNDDPASEPEPVGAATTFGGLSGGSSFSRPRPKVVRPVPVAASARPRLVAPTSFNQAQEVADSFKGGQPVVLNMRQADRDTSRRLIDFSSGLCYGLGGGMEKLDSQVYLLCPTSVEVSADERTRLRDRGYEG